ncbi:MAG: hypothetical protein GY749_35760 [Desulfobacteraceae bacterium]|nr:hypothetical protein [Desulfobacteraceae bacterium]
MESESHPVEVSDEELAKVQIVRDNFHGEWNYTIVPRSC